jgi:hypothetical protein
VPRFRPTRLRPSEGGQHTQYDPFPNAHTRKKRLQELKNGKSRTLKLDETCFYCGYHACCCAAIQAAIDAGDTKAAALRQANVVRGDALYRKKGEARTEAHERRQQRAMVPPGPGALQIFDD